MNRIFHARMTWYNYVYLLILGFTAFALLWNKQMVFAVIIMVFLIILIERIIHSTYTITTDGQLIIFLGRFTKKRILLVKDIRKVVKIKTFRIGRFYLTKYLLLQSAYGYIAITPVKEDEMIAYLVKTNPEIVCEENE